MRYTFAILIICLFFSCKKGGSKEETSFPLILQTENLVKKSDARLFTTNGEVKDQNVIKAFIKNETVFVIPENFIKNGSGLVFLSRDSAMVNGTLKYNVVKDGNLLLFYSPKVVLTNNSLLEQLFKYQAPKTPIPNQNGYNYITQEVRAAMGDYNKLSMSHTSYLLKRGNETKQSGIIFNEFIENVSAKLNAQDTLAYLESSLIFIR